ncbi:hypothetical protein Tco_0541168 [Tanacetum coccineum]
MTGMGSRFVLVFVEAAKHQILGGDQLLVILCGFGTKSLEFGISFLSMTISGAASYAFSDSLLLTPLCCDDIHDVTPRVSALAGCDKFTVVLEIEMDDLPRGFDRRYRSQNLEDIMKACVIDFGSSYHLSIRCASFEALYGKGDVRSPVLHGQIIGMSCFDGLELVPETTDKSLRREIVYCKGDILEARSLFRKEGCLADASLHVSLDEIKVDKTLSFVKEPVEIMDCEVKSLKRSRISLVKVRWNSKHGPEFT